MARFYSANDIINRAALEAGLVPVSDPVGSGDESFVQLSGLLNSAGQEMIELHPWQGLRKKYSFTTQAGDTGAYDLPSDFSYMVDQTGWNRSANLPLGGPLSAQTWSYLDGLDLLESPIYALFQLMENKFQLFPQPPPVGIEIAFQYQSRDWVLTQSTGITGEIVTQGSDTVMYEPILIIKLLLAKFLSAKGFDSSAARLEFDTLFQSRTGKDKGADVLNAGNCGRGYPLINMQNAPWTGYGH